MKPKIAVVRGKFLNRYEMQFFEPLKNSFDITLFGSRYPYHDDFAFPVRKLPSPMDLPDFPFKLPLVNRLFTDGHYLLGLENNLMGYDLVHTAESYFRFTQQVLDAKKRGHVRRVIVTLLENIPFNNEGIRGRKKYKERTFREADHIIALTQKTKAAALLEGADPEKISVISHYIDTSLFKPALRKRQKKLTILFCGRLEVYKGIFDVLAAAKLMRRDRQLKSHEFSFVFVGKGSQMGNMVRTEYDYGISDIVEHKNVSYDLMPSVYRQADIYIAPSSPTPTWEEQYNTSLLEAQASGLPIVSTRSGGIPENISEAGILCEPGDILALASALKRFVLDRKLRQMYGSKARLRAENFHDIHIGAGKLSALYTSLL